MNTTQILNTVQVLVESNFEIALAVTMVILISAGLILDSKLSK